MVVRHPRVPLAALALSVRNAGSEIGFFGSFTAHIFCYDKLLDLIRLSFGLCGTDWVLCRGF